MRPAVEALHPSPHPTEKEVPPHKPQMIVYLKTREVEVDGMVTKVPPRMWKAFLSLAEKPGEGIARQELVYVTRGAGISGGRTNRVGSCLKKDLNEKVGFELITQSGSPKRSYYSLDAEVEMVEEAPKPLARKVRPVEKVVFDARLIESPEKSLLPADSLEIKGFVKKATGGDAESFGKLYDVYLDRIYRHLYYRVGNADVAEDLAAQVFLNAWRAVGRYRFTGRPFIVWLLSIAHNLLVDYYRAKKEVTDIKDVVDRDTNPENDPTVVAERRFESEVLRKAIGQLKRDQQAVVVMRYIDGMEYPEIATALGKKEGAVRIILHRALKALAKTLKLQDVGMGEKSGVVFERIPAQQDVVTRPDKITEPEREVLDRLTTREERVMNKGPQLGVAGVVFTPDKPQPGKPKKPQSLNPIFISKPWEERPVQVQKKPKEEAKRIAMVDDRVARVLGEILLFRPNWQYLGQALARHGVKIDERQYQELQSSHKIFTETMKSDGADNQALSFLTDRIISNFASAHGQSDYARFLFNILEPLPQEELLKVFGEMRFQFVTKAHLL